MAIRTPDVTDKLMKQALRQSCSGLRIKCIIPVQRLLLRFFA